MEEKPQPSGFDTQHLYVWVKSLEAKVNNIIRELGVLKTDMSRKTKTSQDDVKMLTTELLELKREQEQTLQKMDIIIKELKRTAGKEEVLALKKYVDLWNPMHFATERDVERMIELKIKR